MQIFKDDTGQYSMTRVIQLLSWAAGLGLAIYAISVRALGWPETVLIGSMVGITTTAKVIQKKIEKI